MTPEQISDFVFSYLMMRGKPTGDGNLEATLIAKKQGSARILHCCGLVSTHDRTM